MARIITLDYIPTIENDVLGVTISASLIAYAQTKAAGRSIYGYNNRTEMALPTADTASHIVTAWLPDVGRDMLQVQLRTLNTPAGIVLEDEIIAGIPKRVVLPRVAGIAADVGGVMTMQYFELIHLDIEDDV